MSRPWKKQWPRIGRGGRKSYVVGYYDHERVERSKTFASASGVGSARDWMADYCAAERRGPDSLERFLRDLDAKEANTTRSRSMTCADSGRDRSMRSGPPRGRPTSPPMSRRHCASLLSAVRLEPALRRTIGGAAVGDLDRGLRGATRALPLRPAQADVCRSSVGALGIRPLRASALLKRGRSLGSESDRARRL
jgi:hypothetical protein